MGQTSGGPAPPVELKPPQATVQPQAQEQAPPAQPPDRQAPAQQPQPQAQTPQAQTPAAQQPQAQPGSDTAAAIVPVQPQGQWLATDYINTAVYGSSGDIIAYVSNLLLDGQGRVTAVIVSYNTGFLGLGGRDIAVPFSALRIAVADGRALLRINASRADLDRAPAYVRVVQ